jgi:hypothetical protein
MPNISRNIATKRRLDFQESKRHEVADACGTDKGNQQNVLSIKTKDKAYATPSKKARLEESTNEEAYVPQYIHKNLEYLRRGQAILSANKQSAFSLVAQHFYLPKDLETNRKYGSLSGSCMEDRAITAYSMGELEVKNPESDGIKICTACGTEGHVRKRCPHLI